MKWAEKFASGFRCEISFTWIENKSPERESKIDKIARNWIRYSNKLEAWVNNDEKSAFGAKRWHVRGARRKEHVMFVANVQPGNFN